MFLRKKSRHLDWEVEVFSGFSVLSFPSSVWIEHQVRKSEEELSHVIFRDALFLLQGFHPKGYVPYEELFHFERLFQLVLQRLSQRWGELANSRKVLSFFLRFRVTIPHEFLQERASPSHR
jgi:hypothetical protein